MEGRDNLSDSYNLLCVNGYPRTEKADPWPAFLYNHSVGEKGLEPLTSSV